MKIVLVAFIAVLVLSACGASATLTPRPTPTLSLASHGRTDLVNTNLRVTDFPEGSVIVEKPYLVRKGLSEMHIEVPDGFRVRSEVALEDSPSRAAADVQDGCTEHTYWKLVISPGIGDVSRNELWTREDSGYTHAVCFSVRNLWGRVMTFHSKDAETTIKYARLLEKRMVEELRNPSGGS